MKQKKWYTKKSEYKKQLKGKKPKLIDVCISKKFIPKKYFSNKYTIIKTTTPLTEGFVYNIYKNPTGVRIRKRL